MLMTCLEVLKLDVKLTKLSRSRLEIAGYQHCALGRALQDGFAWASDSYK
jgi:hypothetical protein